MPEIQDALRFGKVRVEEIFQAIAAVGDCNLLFRRGQTHFNRFTIQLLTKRRKVEKTR